MQLITDEQRRQMIENGRHREREGYDPVPVVKLFCPWGAATWLLTELDPDEPDRAFGLCDLGFGSPELGYVWLPEIEGLSGLGKVERDAHFKPDRTLSQYAASARALGRIDA